METNENPELLEQVIIQDGSGPQYVINSDLLQSQHGLVVDISGGEFIPVNYGSEDLLPQDLTEEDRNLAAALVSVQLTQQQKQQALQELAAGAASNSGNAPALPALAPLSGKILDGERLVLKKSGANGYLHIVGTDNVYVEKRQAGKVGNKASKAESLTVKTEEEKRDSDDGETTRSETRSAKKSLPHKKRISRKLKKPAAQPNNKEKKVCNLCEQSFATADEFHQHEILCQTTITPIKLMSFNCQLCCTPFTDQLKFFEHLKRHYEPPAAKDTFKKKEKRSPSPELQKDILEDDIQLISEQDATSNTVEIENEVAEVQEKQQESVLSSLLCLTCIECNKTFRRQKTFEQHMRDVHSPKEETMKDEFSETEDFMEGINVVVDENDGGSGFDDDDADEDSKAWYREEELHQTEEDLKELEEESNGHVCHLCKQPFPLRAILLQHLVTCRVLNADAEPTVAPPGPRKKAAKKRGTLQCTECDRTFIHRNSLVYHMRSHTGIRPHQCDQCGKSFFASSALKVHLRLHSGDKPYACTECEKRFRQWGDLKYHMTSIHSNEKNFQCEYCGKEFSRKYSLIVHRRIHTGEKNYKCEFCAKTFRASSYLQNHRRIHTGEKPHSCEICLKPFRVRSDMKRHMKTHQKQPAQRLVAPHVVVATAQEVEGNMVVQAKVEQEVEEVEETTELHIGEDEHILAEYDTAALETTARELTSVRMTSSRNLYINGNELFLVTYPSDIQQ